MSRHVYVISWFEDMDQKHTKSKMFKSNAALEKFRTKLKREGRAVYQISTY